MHNAVGVVKYFDSFHTPLAVNVNAPNVAHDFKLLFVIILQCTHNESFFIYFLCVKTKKRLRKINFFPLQYNYFLLIFFILCRYSCIGNENLNCLFVKFGAVSFTFYSITSLQQKHTLWVHIAAQP
tara:strand:- start:354117 stop:354494 length:378 start_codon:yes stop_codon:yes gene_type:complete